MSPIRPLIRVTIAATMAALLVTACSAGSSPGTRSPDNEPAAFREALIAHVEGRYAEAGRLYRQVLETRPQHVEAEFGLGALAHRAGRLTDAEAHYRLAIGRDPLHQPSLFNLAIIRDTVGDEQGAADLYRHLLWIAPDHAGAHERLGWIYHERGLDAQADAQLELAAQLRRTEASANG